MDESIEDLQRKLHEQMQPLVKYYKYRDLANNYRGQILSFSIEVEREIEEFLSYFFCEKDDKRIIMLDTILCGTLVFAKKIDVCISIFKDLPDEGWDYKFDRVKEFLIMIRDTRNAIAHRALQIAGFVEASEENKFIFKDKFGNKAPKEITDKYLEEFIEKSCYCIDFFRQEIDKIKNPSLTASTPKRWIPSTGS